MFVGIYYFQTLPTLFWRITILTAELVNSINDCVNEDHIDIEDEANCTDNISLTDQLDRFIRERAQCSNTSIKYNGFNLIKIRWIFSKDPEI